MNEIIRQSVVVTPWNSAYPSIDWPKFWQLRGFEFAKAVTLVSEPFSMENSLLTPTMKASAHP